MRSNLAQHIIDVLGISACTLLTVALAYVVHEAFRARRRTDRPEWKKGERVPLKRPVFSQDEIQSINDYQKAGFMHPLTCGNGCGDLVATPNGLFCPVCKEVVQTWCHEDIKDGSWRAVAERTQRWISSKNLID